MTVLITVVYVWSPMIVEVLAGTLDSVVKSLTLNVPELRGRCVPSTRSLSVSRTGSKLLCHYEARRSKSESKYGECQSIELHCIILRAGRAPLDSDGEI